METIFSKYLLSKEVEEIMSVMKWNLKKEERERGIEKEESFQVAMTEFIVISIIHLDITTTN